MRPISPWSDEPRVNALGYRAMSVRMPTLAIHGEADAAVAPSRARRLAEAIPGARWVEIPRAGHCSTIEEPAAVAATIDAFLSEAA